MSDSINENLSAALRKLLMPIVELLMSQGMTHKEFSEDAKEAFVQVAIKNQKESRINRSRIAIVTGLTRKDVKAVIDRATEKGASGKTHSRPGRVLGGWYTDPHYQGPYGVPLEISYDNEQHAGEPPCFVHLVKQYSGDQSPVQMLDELLRVKAVEKTPEGTLKPLRQDFEPASLSPQLIDRFGDAAYEVLKTLALNVRKKNIGEGIFDRRAVSNEKLTVEELADFDRYLKEKGTEMIFEIDNWLTRSIRKKAEGVDPSTLHSTSVLMIQYFEDDEKERETLKDTLLTYVSSNDH